MTIHDLTLLLSGALLVLSPLLVIAGLRLRHLVKP